MERGSKRLAVVVGVSAYDDEQIPSLRYARNDAIRLRDTLVQHCGFARDDVHLLVNGDGDNVPGTTPPTRVDVLQQLNYVAQSATADDLVLIFFAGHGAEVSQTPYLVASDTRLDVLKHSALDLNAINDILQGCKAKCIVRVFDACRAPFAEGRGFGGRMTHGLEEALIKSPSGWASFSSCSSGEVAREADEFEQGVFSYYLCEGLGGQGAGSDGWVTLESLVAYVKSSVGNWCRRQSLVQTPHFQADIAGVLGFSQSKPSYVADAAPTGHPLDGLRTGLDIYLSSAPADIRGLSLTTEPEMQTVVNLVKAAIKHLVGGYEIRGAKVDWGDTSHHTATSGTAWQEYNTDANALKFAPLSMGHSIIWVDFTATEPCVPDVELTIVVVRLSFLYMIWYCGICTSAAVRDFKPSPRFVKGSFQFKPQTAIAGVRLERAVREILARSSELVPVWASQLSDRIAGSIQSFRDSNMRIE